MNDQAVQSILSLVNAPHASGYVSRLGGKDRASILLTFSLDARNEWKYGILENSRYAKFHWDTNQKLSLITGKFKMRKRLCKDIEAVALTIRKALSNPKGDK